MFKIFVCLFLPLLFFQAQGSLVSTETFNTDLDKQAPEFVFSKYKETSRWEIQNGLTSFLNFKNKNLITQLPVSLNFEFPLMKAKFLSQLGVGLMYDDLKSEPKEKAMFPDYYFAQIGFKFKIHQHENISRFASLTGGILYPSHLNIIAYTGNLMLEVVTHRTDNIIPNPKIGFQFLYLDGKPYFGLAFHIGVPLISQFQLK